MNGRDIGARSAAAASAVESASQGDSGPRDVLRASRQSRFGDRHASFLARKMWVGETVLSFVCSNQQQQNPRRIALAPIYEHTLPALLLPAPGTARHAWRYGHTATSPHTSATLAARTANVQHTPCVSRHVTLGPRTPRSGQTATSHTRRPHPSPRPKSAPSGQRGRYVQYPRPAPKCAQEFADFLRRGRPRRAHARPRHREQALHPPSRLPASPPRRAWPRDAAAARRPAWHRRDLRCAAASASGRSANLGPRRAAATRTASCRSCTRRESRAARR